MNNKIAHIVLNTFENDSRVMRQCKSLNENGKDVTIIAIWSSELKLNEKNNWANIIRIPIKSKPWGSNHIIKIIKYLEFCIKSIRVIYKIRPMICHAHDPDALFIGYISKTLFNTKLIYDSHELWSASKYLNTNNHLLYKIGNFLEKKLIIKADSVITVCNSIAELLKEKYVISNINVLRNVPNRVEITKKYTKEELGFPQNKKNIIYSGRITRGRGLEILIEYFNSNIADFGLVVMGPGDEYKKYLVELVDSYRLSGNIKFLNPVAPEDVVSVCRLADAGIAPIENICKSYYYSLPNKLFEYIVAGIPVLCSDFPEMKNLVLSNNIGKVFNIDDVSSLYGVLDNIFISNEINIFKQNVSKMSNECNWESEKLILDKIYNEI